MKKTIYILLFSLISGALFTSCEDMFGDFLNKQPSNELTEKEVFSLWSNTQRFHYDTYNFLRHGAGRINSSWMDAATDLGHTSYSNGGTRTSFNIGNYYASSGAPELTATWEHYYRGIRKCNMLLQNIDTVPKAASDTEEVYEKHKANYKAESRFLRAYFYWELFLRYGPVPIIDKVLDPESDLITEYVNRPSAADFISFVMTELNECEADLMAKPAQDDLIGRISKPMASALRSRIALYMASERYKLYTWQQAADAAKSFIDTYGSSYGLYYGTSGDPLQRYQEAVLVPVHNANNEVIFWRNDGIVGWNAIVNDSPVGEGGRGGLCPTQNLVDMYDMANGQSPFASYDDTGAPVYDGSNSPTVNSASGYSESNPYANRDPRFYRTVLYNQSLWNNATIDVVKGGRDNPIGNANATPTGYYLRKYIPEGIVYQNHSGTAYRNWIFIRYAEILLNYAEAQNEISGPTSEVFETLQLIRNRAGLTQKLEARTDIRSKDTMRKFIRKERTVELAFEDHRAWDVRRWNVAVEALARPVYGMEITKDGSNNFVYTRKVVQKRIFSNKMYLYPIPEAEVWKTGIENNSGW